MSRRCNQGIALTFAAALLAACGGDGNSGESKGLFDRVFDFGPSRSEVRTTVSESGLVFFGVAAGDEPNAARAAEEVLKFGGTAADAAVALALAMTVTMPSTVSLGAGGVCVVHDPSKKQTEFLDFIAPAGTGGPAAAGAADRPSAVPTLLRGLAALHVRYGRMDLRGLLATAEKSARFGHTVSRAFARDLSLAATPLFADPQARAIFAGSDGLPVGEGATLIQRDLADTYASVRTNGINSFYEGPFARRLVRAVRAAGGTLTLDDLRRFRPKWRKGTAIRFRDQTIVFAPPPAGVGVGGSLMWRMLADGERYRDATEDEKLHLFVEAAKRAFAARPGWLRRSDPAATARLLADPQWAAALMKGYRADSASAAATLTPPPVPVAENPAGTGFVVVDLVGQAVACTLTNYNLFGTGRVAPGTGIVLAAAPAPGTDRNALSLGPVLSFETKTRRFRFAAAGAGGAAALTATMMVAGETLLRQTTLEKGINAPRVHDTGAPDVVLAERSLPAKQVAALRARGHRVQTVPTLGRVNAAECPLGLNSSSEEIACFVFADPRGAGMATEAER